MSAPVEDVVAVIPAREGSKRVPGKNIAPFRGRPLVAHTIEQALEAGLFGQIIVSTDDPRVAQAAAPYPVEVAERPAHLAGDSATLLQVLVDLAARLGWAAERVVGLLQVTAPLRSVADIRAAYALFCASDRREAVVSVTEHAHPIHMSWSQDPQGHLLPVFPEDYERSTRKQDHQRTYYWNDAVMFDSVANLRRPGRNLFGPRPRAYVMPWERSVNIDYPFQLEVCRLLGERPGGAG